MPRTSVRTRSTSMEARVAALEALGSKTQLLLESMLRFLEDKFASIDKRFDAIESRRKSSDQTCPPPSEEDDGDGCRRRGGLDQREREREGWGVVIAKTVSVDAVKVINVTPQYARLRAGANGSAKGQIIGWENIELISDRPLETMLKEFKQLKEEYPDRILIASIMEEYNKAAWEELIDRVEQTGIDALEINFSCPHGMPERKMGAAVGQDCALLEEVCGWINAKATVPVWAKMTPNITDITQPARVALKSGCEGVAAINTIMSVMGINLKTLRPEPCVEGYSTPGGYSSKAVHPIALGKVMNIAKLMKSEFDLEKYSLSGIGGVETGGDAAEFILVGANTVQVCTGVMMHGYGLVKKLCDELKDFMKMHNFSSIEDFRGTSLEYFTTHTDLVRRQQEAIQQRKAVKNGLQSDKDWTGDGFVKESESMVSN